MNKPGFGKRLNNVRKEQRITSEGLSEMCGVNAVFIRNIECANRLPSLPVLVKISNALHISTDYLLADSLEPNERDEFNILWQKVRKLTPKKIKLVSAMIDTLIEQLDEDEDEYE